MSDQTAKRVDFEKKAEMITGGGFFGSDPTAKGVDFEKEADKKIRGWGFFGVKYKGAADLYNKAATGFKIGKEWDRAGAVYIKLAKCHLKSKNKIEAAEAYVDAAKCYKKSSVQEKENKKNHPEKKISDQAMSDQTAKGVDFEKKAEMITGGGFFGSDPTAKGVAFEKEADKKIRGWGFFGVKYKGAVELYNKAATGFKIGKEWDRAGAVYIKLAKCHLKSKNKIEAAEAYVDAAKCYKRSSVQDAAQCFDKAVNLYVEICQVDLVAECYKELGELYEQEEDLERAMDYFEQAADLFDTEEVYFANQCKQKVAQFAAQMERFPEAIGKFEEIARDSIKDNSFRYRVSGILLNAGICQVCRRDVVAITRSLEQYQELDPTFSGTHEYKFLAKLRASMCKEDVGKFIDSIKEYTRLDPWQKALLLSVGRILKAKEEFDLY